MYFRKDRQLPECHTVRHRGDMLIGAKQSHVNFHLKTDATSGAQLHTLSCSEWLQLLPVGGSGASLAMAVPSQQSDLRILLLLGLKSLLQKGWEDSHGTCYLDLCLLLGPAEILSSPRSKGVFTFNDSPRCFPAQDSFAIHLVLLVAAHYCEGHAFLLGRDMWRDLLNPFQRAAPSLFPIHLSSSQLTKYKAFSMGRGSPEQHFTGSPLHPSMLSLAFWALALQVSLHPPSLVGSFAAVPRALEQGAELFCTHLQCF